VDELEGACHKSEVQMATTLLHVHTRYDSGWNQHEHCMTHRFVIRERAVHGTLISSIPCCLLIPLYPQC
jgi:hypothetical protein